MLSLEFVAGLITGEGCFCFSVQRVKRRKAGDGLRITPIFAMYMSDRETVQAVADSLRHHGLPVYQADRPKAGRGQCGVMVNGIARVLRYVDTFEPLLTGQKKRAAEIAGEFCRSRLETPNGAGHGYPYSERELELVRESRRNNGNTNGRKTPL